jgi:hypothetical protein
MSDSQQSAIGAEFGSKMAAKWDAAMQYWFDMDGLDVGRLLADWQWLCPLEFSPVARNVFGDLFLRDGAGCVFWLNATVGRIDRVTRFEAEFRELAETAEKRKEWFTEPEMLGYRKLGLSPDALQCIGFSVPAMFRGGGKPDTAYVADLYEYVAFLGDLHRQMADLPDGSTVQLRVNPPKPAGKKP